MNALLKRDLSVAALFTLLGTIAITIALTQDQFRQVWVFEPSRLEATFYTAWVAGLVLGAFVAVRDRVNGVGDYVRQRPMSPLRLHVGRLLLTALVLVAWWVLAPLGSWLCEAIGGRLVSVGQPGRYWLLLASMAPAASAAALALLCASLPVASWMQAVLATALLFVGFPACDAMASTSTFDNPLVYALAHFAFAAGLAALSCAFAGVERDPDRSWTRRVPRWATALVLAVGVAGGTLLLGLFTQGLLGSFADAYPSIGRVGDRYELLAWEARSHSGLRRYRVVDAEHQPTGDLRSREGVTDLYWPRIGWSRDPEIEPPNFRQTDWQSGWSALRLDRHGFANCLLHDTVDWTSRFFVFGRGDATTPFDGRAHLVSLGTDGHASREVATFQSIVWVAEPGATEVFRFDPSIEQVRAVPLPGGDRIVDVVDQEQDDPRALVGFTKPSTIVRGERAAYAFANDGLVPVVPAASAAIEAREAKRAAGRAQNTEVRRETVVADVLCPTIRVVGRDGTALFEHAYAPRTTAERLAYAVAVVPSLVRAPLLQVAAHVFVGETSPTRASPFVDPVVAGGYRTWLVFAGFLCNGVLAFFARRRLQRAGADARTLRFWTVAVTLLGLVAALLCEVFEPSRAWRMPAAGPKRAPRIRTAAVA